MRRKWIAPAAIAIALAGAVGIAPAWAYFTDSSTATGAMSVNVKPTTDITETYATGVKHVVVANDEDAEGAVFVRAKVFAASSLTIEVSGTSWSSADADGWYAYVEALEPGSATEELMVRVGFPAVKSDELPTGAVIGDNYNVVVIYESTPVLFHEDGTAYADWTYILDTGTQNGGE